MKYSRPIYQPRYWIGPRRGLYSQSEVQRGLPVKLLIKYFTQAADLWRIAPEIRAMVKFRRLNLVTDFAALGTFDVIFCRNVLIYFDQETKSEVLDRLARVISSDGYLVLGAAETAVGLSNAFAMVADKPGLYMPLSKRLAPCWRNRRRILGRNSWRLAVAANVAVGVI